MYDNRVLRARVVNQTNIINEYEAWADTFLEDYYRDHPEERPMDSKALSTSTSNITVRFGWWHKLVAKLRHWHFIWKTKQCHGYFFYEQVPCANSTRYVPEHSWDDSCPECAAKRRAARDAYDYQEEVAKQLKIERARREALEILDSKQSYRDKAR